ncbi:MAG TPA: FHIPEP family type III secretion protein [Candidatus Gastranaerophilaceae bacterium]|nr:FHIPEP family type III secretion protein [Candidatus Gastranaerophilaceae bacterium]HPT41768.1 FHIPEP family type III secretion protein [Candidatus Gastranaerophilaceae bacterium]
MFKNSRMQYVIKSVPSDNTKALENLLNEMSQGGWDLYSMHEVEAEEGGYQYNCIFAGENPQEQEIAEEDVVNIKNFKTQMEKMLSSQLSPYESCRELQEKIKEQRKKINKIKTQLEAQSEAPISKNRKQLNDEISKGLRDLEDLRQQLIKTISPDVMYSKIKQEKLSISLSEEILDLVNPDLAAELVSETVNLRQKITDRLGYVIPKIIFQDDDNLSPYEFSIKIRGQEVLNSFAYPKYLMFFEDDLKLSKKEKGAIYSVDEITGKKIVWLEEKKTKSFWQKGLKPSEFICRLLENIIIKYIDEIFDYSDINRYMEIVSQENMFLIENIIPDFISAADLRYILVNLLREEVCIKDIIYIFEKINDFSDEETKEDLLDKIRLSLSRFISKGVASADNVIQAFELSEATYKSIFSKINSKETVIKIDGTKIEKIAKNIYKKAKSLNIDLENMVVLTPLEARHMMFMILSQFVNNIKVLAKEEISNDFVVEIIDEI